MLMGYAGQVSLGQASFYALGGYAAGLISVHGGPTLLGLIAAPAVAAAVALVVGVPILRLRGHQLAFATLVGGLLLGVAQAMVAGYLSTSYQSEVALLLMLIVLIVQAARRPMILQEPA